MLPRTIWFITLALTLFYTCHKSGKQRPTVELTASHTTVTKPCPPGGTSQICTPTSEQVQLSAKAKNFPQRKLTFTYSTTGGRISGDGPNVTWDLSGVQEGRYTATVEVRDDRDNVAFDEINVTVNSCRCVPACSSIEISCPPDTVQQGTPATVSANVDGGSGNPTYNWSVSAGTISSGQGTSSITVNTSGLGGRNVTATVKIGGMPPECEDSRGCTFSVIR